MKNGGEIETISDIEPDPCPPKAQGVPGNYYINFQDRQGEPVADPLTVDGKTYMKIVWNFYDAELGYGWYGDFNGSGRVDMADALAILQQISVP